MHLTDGAVASAPLSPGYSRWEDVYGLAIASTLLGVGAFLLRKAGVTTGGTVGFALILTPITALPYGIILMLLNLPLFLCGWRLMGPSFITKSLCVTAMTALLVDTMPHNLTITAIHPLFAALAGGTIVGMGAVAAPRHGAAAGGTLVIILWLQRRFDRTPALHSLSSIFSSSSPPLCSWGRWWRCGPRSASSLPMR